MIRTRALRPHQVSEVSPLWSLSVEEQFYLVYPALLILIATGRNWGSL